MSCFLDATAAGFALLYPPYSLQATLVPRTVRTPSDQRRACAAA